MDSGRRNICGANMFWTVPFEQANHTNGVSSCRERLKVSKRRTHLPWAYWMDCCEKAALAQESRLSAAVAPETTNNSKRFKHFVSDEQLSELSKGHTPKNTEASRTSAISDLCGLFVVSRRFLAIPVLLGLLSRYILSLCNESCASTVASLDFLYSEEVNKLNQLTRNNDTCQLTPLTHSQDSQTDFHCTPGHKLVGMYTF